MNRPLVIAHRGFSSRHPENTLTAYRAAIAAGADLVESDARLSRDGAVWSCHDATLARLTGDDRAIADLTSSELAEIELPQGERLASLRQVLDQIATERTVLIDVKTDELDLIDAIVHEVNACDVARVWIGMRSPAQMKRAKAARPDLSLLALLPDYWLAEEFDEAGASAFRVWEGDLERMEEFPLLGQRTVWVTAGGRGTAHEVGDTTPEGIRRILKRRPGGVLLNDPMLLIGRSAELDLDRPLPLNAASGSSA